MEFDVDVFRTWAVLFGLRDLDGAGVVFKNSAVDWACVRENVDASCLHLSQCSDDWKCVVDGVRHSAVFRLCRAEAYFA